MRNGEWGEGVRDHLSHFAGVEGEWRWTEGKRAQERRGRSASSERVAEQTEGSDIGTSQRTSKSEASASWYREEKQQKASAKAAVRAELTLPLL